MIQNRDAQQGADTHQATGDTPVLGARAWIAAGMIVNQHQRSGGFPERGSKHVPWMDEACGERPQGYRDFSDQTVAPVQEKQKKLLLARASQSFAKVSIDIGGAPYGGPRMKLTCGNPSSDLKRRNDRGGFGGAHAGCRHQFGDVRLGQTAQTGPAPHQIGDERPEHAPALAAA